MEDGKSLFAWTLLIMLSLIWGSSFILIKKGLIHLTAEEVGALRIFSAGIVLIPIAIRKWAKVRPKDWKYLLSVGFLGSLIPSFLFAVAQTRLQSSVVGILNALTPLFTLLAGMLIYRIKHGHRTFVGIGIGLVGTILLLLSDVEGGITFNSYGLLIVLATILYATNLNIIKYHLAHLQALTITGVSLTFVGAIAGIYIFTMTDFSGKILVGGEVALSIFYILILGVFGTALAFVLFNKLVQVTNPLFTSSVTYIIPIVAVMWGLLDGEVLVAGHYFGMLAIVFGVYVANRSRSMSKT